MIFCQYCLTSNSPEAELCSKCGNHLLVLGGNRRWDEPEMARVSMDDHFLERISNLEETVNNILEHLSRVVESNDVIDRNVFITRSGLSALVETLKETNLLREELLYQRWEATMVEQMEEARYRDRFSQLKNRFLALYRGAPTRKTTFNELIEEAEFLIYSDRFPESAGVLIKALKLDKQNYELAYYLAEYHQQQGMNSEAVTYLEMALEANPNHSDSLLVLSLLYYGEDKVAASKELLERCLEVDPHNTVALLSMGSVLTAERRFAEARPLLERVNELDSQAQSYYLLGLGSREEGRLMEAIEHLSFATELDPDHEDAIFTLGMAYLARGWTRKANTCFAQAMELNPDKMEYQEAARIKNEADETSPGFDAESMKTLTFADNLFRQGKFKQALPHYRHLLKKHPTNHILLSTFAVLNFHLRRYEETLKAARKILARPLPELVRCVAYTMQMESLRVQDRYEEAIESLLVMLEEFPDGYGRTIAQYGLAMTKADLGRDLKQAEDLARAALETCPADFRHNALDALGWVYFKQGRYEEALELLKSAVAMRESINHLYHYGMILLALNLQEEAFKVFERTVKLRNKTGTVDDFIYLAIQKEMEMADTDEDMR